MTFSRALLATLFVLSCNACSSSTRAPDSGSLVYPFACQCDCLGCVRASDGGTCVEMGRVMGDISACVREMSAAQAQCAEECDAVFGTDCIATAGPQQSTIACDIPFDGDGIDR